MKILLLVLLLHLSTPPSGTPSVARPSAPAKGSGRPSAHPGGRQSRPKVRPVRPDTLPPIHTLHTAIDSFYAQQTKTQLLEFKDSKKGEWLKFLPNLGITYTVNGQPRPSISISSGIFYQAKKARQTRAAKRQSIIESNRLEAQNAKSHLEELILRYEMSKQEIAFQQQLHQVEQALFLIQEDEYNRQERAPSDYLQAKRTFLLQQQALREKESQLEILKMEVWRVAHLEKSR